MDINTRLIPRLVMPQVHPQLTETSLFSRQDTRI